MIPYSNVIRTLALLALGAMACRGRDVQPGTESLTLPPLSAIVALHGKSTLSPEFLDVKRRCNLKLYLRNQNLIPAEGRPGGVFPDQNQVIIYKAYAGSGLIVVGYSIVYTKTDLEAVAEPDAIVEKVQIIIGDCRERDLFGKWQGEMPPLELPLNPDALLTKHKVPDEDTLEHKFIPPDTHPSYSTRRISYYNSALANSFPYAFVFVHDRLAIIEVWPGSAPRKATRE